MRELTPPKYAYKGVKFRTEMEL